jgi:hypothetical protein
MYFVPFCFADFSAKLERRGVRLVVETVAPRQSIAELYAQRHALGRPLACRAAYRFLSFELLDECGEMRGNGGREDVVLILEALPNC